MNTGLSINFRNHVQAVLFECELKGQLSDGRWENTRPLDHWKKWCNAIVGVNSDNLGKNFYAKSNYNFAAPDLLSAVENRMLTYANLALYGFSISEMHIIENLFGLRGGFDGVPDYFDAKQIKALGLILEVKNTSLQDLKKIGESRVYSKKDLLRDLNDMKKIIKMEQK